MYIADIYREAEKPCQRSKDRHEIDIYGVGIKVVDKNS